MDKRMFLAVGLCLVVLAVFQTFFLSPGTPPANEPASSVQTSSTAEAAPSLVEPSPSEPEPAATATSDVTTVAIPSVRGQAGDASVQLHFNSAHGVTAMTLPDYTLYLTETTPVDVLGLPAARGELTFWGGKLTRANYAVEASTIVSHSGEYPVQLAPAGPYQLRLHPQTAAEVKSVSLRITKHFMPPPSSMGAPVQAGFLFHSGDEITRVKLDDLAKGYEVAADVDWIGLEEQYFILLLRTADAARTKARVQAQTVNGMVTVTLEVSMVLAADAESVLAYAGPKDTVRLAALDRGLERSVDFGWFALVARPMLSMLRLIEMGIGNWGVAIILLTLLIKMVLLPLQIKFTESMYRMQAMKPQMDKLREKFKDDAMRMNQELAAMYKREGINPLGGCLPVLMQIPIFVALYNVLAHAIELRHAPFFGWIHDLSQAESVYTLHMFGFDLPLRILPVLMMGSTLLQNKLTPTTIDNEQQRIMMTWMPIIFTVLFYSMPSGLMIYWLSQNLITVGQNELIKRRMAARGLLPVSAAPKK